MATKIKIIIIVALIVPLSGLVISKYFKYRPNNLLLKGGTMEITSLAFENNNKIPLEYSCDGAGTNPPLTLTGLPTAAKSLALIVDDPDAPGGDFVHWVVWNIASTVTDIKAGSIPADAVEGVNSARTNKWVAPCPPSGTHRYNFKLYALDIVLSLDSKSDKYTLLKAIQGHILDQAQLTGLYQRR